MFISCTFVPACLDVCTFTRILNTPAHIEIWLFTKYTSAIIVPMCIGPNARTPYLQHDERMMLITDGLGCRGDQRCGMPSSSQRSRGMMWRPLQMPQTRMQTTVANLVVKPQPTPLQPASCMTCRRGGNSPVSLCPGHCMVKQFSRETVLCCLGPPSLPGRNLCSLAWLEHGLALGQQTAS